METRTFGHKDLRKLFPELEKREELTLIPLVDTVFWQFWKEIGKFPAKFEITDIMGLGRSLRRFILVLNGKLILISPIWKNIDVSEEIEPWLKIHHLLLKGDEKTVVRFLNFLKAFLQQQSLDKLISITAFNLRERGTHHLSQETRNCYFGSSGILHL